MTKKKQEKKLIDKVKSFFNKPAPLLLVMSVILVLMMIYTASLKQSGDLYAGLLEKDNIVIQNVHYFITDKTNYFYSSNVSITNPDEIKLSKYNLGFYVKDSKGEYHALVTRSGELETPINMDEIVYDFSSFNFAELRSQSVHFTKEVMNNLDNLYFVVYGSTSLEDDIELLIEEEINITKLSE